MFSTILIKICKAHIYYQRLSSLKGDKEILNNSKKRQETTKDAIIIKIFL